MKKLRTASRGQHLISLWLRPCHVRTIQRRTLATTAFKGNSAATSVDSHVGIEDNASLLSLNSHHPSSPYPSPLPERASHSAKLAALHARLALSKRLPLETLARSLVDPSADSNPNFNNSALAQLGRSVMSYHVGEYLLCKYPRLPISVLFAASFAYNGPKTLQLVAQEWGVETAAAPGSEVDPGLLQFSKLRPGTTLEPSGASTRPDAMDFYRRGMTSRLVYDDEFGDKVPKLNTTTAPITTDSAYAGFVRALVGALYLHAGQKIAKTFVKQQILSRHLDMSTLFQFKNPIRELTRLCNREEFELPIARIISESGRWSRAPVFVVGIYSGKDLLGQGSGPSLPEARIRGCVAALKSWYLYSPGNDTNVPSDTEGQNGNKKWEPVHIDLGEIVLS
ncbi:hypothetical protein K3495_g2144 [Podosphaera aphanis]|nr:hypothetical protein K3495_g2144 [Podosphaera aphanis]